MHSPKYRRISLPFNHLLFKDHSYEEPGGFMSQTLSACFIVLPLQRLGKQADKLADYCSSLRAVQLCSSTDSGQLSDFSGGLMFTGNFIVF